MSEKFLKNIDYRNVLKLKDLISYAEGGINSKTIVQRDEFSVSLISFDDDEALSRHTAPGDAWVYAIEGKAEISIGDEKVTLTEGDTVVMPANVSHAVQAVGKYKMMLVVVKPQKTGEGGK
jgi:quercetin dioxygenase-like cupin family protein